MRLTSALRVRVSCADLLITTCGLKPAEMLEWIRLHPQPGPVSTNLWRKTMTEEEKRAFKEAGDKPKGKAAPKGKGKGKGKGKACDATAA